MNAESFKVSRLLAGVIALALAFALFSLTFAVAAYAGSAFSATGYFTVNGIQYKNRALISTSTSTLWSQARTDVAGNSQSVPSGWMGAAGRMFTSGGSLYCAGAYQYNSGTYAAGDWLPAFSCSQSGTSRAWYSHGLTRGWTGSAYSNYYTYVSPNQNS